MNIWYLFFGNHSESHFISHLFCSYEVLSRAWFGKNTVWFFWVFFFFVVLGPTHWSTGISFMVCDLYSVCDLSHHSVSYVKVVSLMTSMLVKDHLHLGAPIYDMLIIYSDANQLL